MNNVTELATREEIDGDLLVVDYVADRLSAEARADFERRLASDAGLRRAVDEERELHALLSGSSETGVPSKAGFEQLRDQVETDRKLSLWRSPSIAAGVAAIAVVLVLTLQQPEESSFAVAPDELSVPLDELQTFTGLSESPTPPSEQNRVTIVFAPGLTPQERAVVASQLGFELVDGPSEAGAWTAVTTPGVNRDDLSRWLSDPRIDLAEPQRYE